MPHLTHLEPTAALPGGELTLHGADLMPAEGLPQVTLDSVEAAIVLARGSRLTVRVPDTAASGEAVVRANGQNSNPLNCRLGTLLSENLHPVSSPAVDALGNVYTTLSGARGQQTPVSVFRIAETPTGTWELRPYARDILNATGLAFGPDGLLYASSRAEGIVYRIGHSGVAQVYAEGLGIASGLAFDAAGDLYVGDRSGTVFKIRGGGSGNEAADRETFVFSTLEPSISAFHLAFAPDGTLYVTGPTPSSSQSIHAIAPDGTARVFFSGLGRAQGLAFTPDGTLYVAASLRGDRGLVSITPDGRAELAVSAPSLVGVAFDQAGHALLTTRDAVFRVALA